MEESAITRLELSPAAPLRPFVCEFALVSVGRGSLAVESLPDGTMSLFFRSGQLVVAGARTRALYKDVAGAPFVIQARFRPGGAWPFFGPVVAVLTDRIVPLAELWGPAGPALCERLATAGSPCQAARELETSLVERLRRDPLFDARPAHLARRAVRIITSSLELPRVDALAARLGVSTRHLRRAVHQAVGIAPKEFIRIIRFQRALAGLRERSAAADLAAATGYYDQAHMTAEFRALAGVTPGAWLRRTARR